MGKGKKGKGKRAGYVRDAVDLRDFPDDDLPVIVRGGRMESQTATKPKEPVDPAKVAMALAAITKVEVGIPEAFTSPITFVVAGNGVFKVQQTVLGRTITKLEGLPTVAAKLEPGFHLTVPKIPFSVINQVVAFFKAVCKKAGNPVEAYCQVWYSTEANLFFLQVPEQKVSGGSVEHKGDSRPTDKLIHVADIHSHGSMSAFFSGVDDTDERDQGVRIFGVIGNVNTPKPSLKWRMGNGNGTFTDMKMEDVVDFAESEVTIRLSPMSIMGDSVSINTTKLNPWTEVEIPAAWLDKVTTQSYTVYHGGRTGHQHDGMDRGTPSYYGPHGYGHSEGGSHIPTVSLPSGYYDAENPRRFIGRDGDVWELDPGKGWQRTGKIDRGKAKDTTSPTNSSDTTETIGGVSAAKRFHTSIGTLLVEKDHLRLIPMVGQGGVGV